MPPPLHPPPAPAPAELIALHQLARLHGVQLGYYDVVARRPRRASPQTLLAVLRALEAPVESLRDVPAALRQRRQELWRRVLEPVTVAWEGAPRAVGLRLPAAWAEATAACGLELEGGERRSWTCRLAAVTAQEAVEEEGTRYLAKALPLPADLPRGYHRLGVEIQGQAFDTLLIAAPLETFTLPEAEQKCWGAFLPLYALHSRRSPAGGDFSDLEAFLEWAIGQGASTVGTLPLLAAFLDEPFAPSPYMPVSCLFWNELFVDLARIPELAQAPAAQTLLASSAFQKELESLAGSSLVDYRRAMALKRRVLDELARHFFSHPGGRQAAFQRFLALHPAAEDYARFRAACERRRAAWPAWPEAQREGALEEGDYDESVARYHLYAQWQAHEQFQVLADKARRKGRGLYLDLPLGVHPDGYDVWRHRAVFALGASAGAPPDAFFVRGQNWGVPPLHPERTRQGGYRYFIARLRQHFQVAGIVRIDHVMGLHRLFWIPRGLEVSDGVYVRKPAQEFYAILALESHRHKTVIVGEDLGTVPRYVRLALARHRILRSYVLQFESTSDSRRALRPVPADCQASLNTHDIRPFAGFWREMDIGDRLELGLVNESDARRLRGERQALRQALVAFLQRDGWLARGAADLLGILKACVAWLGAGPARLVLLNLEDLWLETEQQNTPGTVGERPNWRRKARYRLEEFSRLPAVLELLREVDRRRKATAS